MTKHTHKRDLRFMLTNDERDAMFMRQNGRCLICVRREATDVDHNHATGEVRGMLCNRCNTLLGKVRESPSRLRRLAERRPLNGFVYRRAANYLEVFGYYLGSYSRLTPRTGSSKDTAQTWLEYYRKHLG